MFTKIALAAHLLVGPGNQTLEGSYQFQPLFPYVCSNQIESLLVRTMRFFFNEYSMYPEHFVHEKWLKLI